MKVHNKKLKASTLSVAVQGALVAMFSLPMMANAADTTDLSAQAIAEIRKPTNYIEFGVEHVSRDSAKFGEYNGLSESGAEVIGNFSVRGGDAYGGGDGTMRWGVTGSDLGTTSREFGATIQNQGRWNLGIGYDELKHVISDTYQTPLIGSKGNNFFAMPTSFGVVNASATRTGNPGNPVDPVMAAVPGIPAATLNGLAPGPRVLNDTQRGLFHTEEVSSTRKNTSFNAGYIFNPQLSVQFDYNNLKQSGAKLISAANAPATTPLPTTGTSWRAEGYAILLNPTNYNTDTYNLALNWKGDKGHLTASYFASIFRNDDNSLTWNSAQSGGAAANLQTAPCGAGTTSASCYYTGVMSVAPGNDFHQFNLSGGYDFTSATKLTGGISYGRNTQDDSYLTGRPEAGALPAASLNGEVISKHADLKLINKTTKDLTLSAGYKYNERDNNTSSRVYQYAALNSLTLNDFASNAPYSNKKQEFELAGNYRIDKRQSVQLAYNYDKVDRWCNQYTHAANCVVASSNTEDRLGAKYKLKATDTISLSAGYTYGNRKGSYDYNAITPLSGLDTATTDDVNSQNFRGFVAAPYAERKQDLFKAGFNWQATDKLDLSVEGRYTKDRYGTTLGLQDGKSTGVSLDATYSYSEDSAVSAYIDWQGRSRNNRVGASSTASNPDGAAGTGVNAAASYSLLTATPNIFAYDLDEDGHTFGLNTKHRLMGGKLELVGDLSYSFDQSSYKTTLGYTPDTGCISTNMTSCGALPDIDSRVTTLKLKGTYQVDKMSKVAIAYIYQNRRTRDFYYKGTQYGYTPARGLPTNEQEPNYSISVIAVSYIYNFK
jgi:MtrB/PioB family decaheme-associated outer membrane protein